MTKHSPAPWYVAEDFSGEHGQYSILDAEGTELGAAVAWIGEHRAESEANARLIAAAPELLEAVREALGVLELADAYGLYEPGSLGDADVKDCRDQLRAAHRKATGLYFTPTEVALGADETQAPAQDAPQ